MVQLAPDVYQALNQKLLDDLPPLIKLSEQVLMTCVTIFIELMKKLQEEVLKVRNIHHCERCSHGCMCTMAMGVGKGGRRPPWILKFSAKNGCFLSSVEKTNFTTFGSPLKKFCKNP